MDEPVYSHRRVDRTQLSILSARSDGRGLTRTAGHGAVLLATGTLLGQAIGSWWVVPATVLHGAVLIFLFAPLHEAIHRTAFRSRWLNDVVGWFCGALLVLPPEYFRYFHFAHHRYTQDPANDPELAVPKPASLGVWLVQVSGWNYWRAQIGGTFAHALGRTTERFLTAGNRSRVIREARVVIGAYAGIGVVAIAFNSWAPVIYWLLPALAGQPFLRLYLLAEHTGCPLVPDMLANSRTTLTNAVARFFTWNMPYHAEHHAFPAVPFHALPALHRVLAPDLKVVSTGYVAVQRELLRSFRQAAVG